MQALRILEKPWLFCQTYNESKMIEDSTGVFRCSIKALAPSSISWDSAQRPIEVSPKAHVFEKFPPNTILYIFISTCSIRAR